MTDAFAQLTGPIFRYLIDLPHRLERGEDPPAPEVRADLLALLDEADRRAAVAADLAGDFALARHALVYWIDEMLIRSSWSHAAEWRELILEWDFYRERLGGEKFYDKVEEAERLTSTRPLETFYVCVALGFRGKFGNDREALRRWGDRIFPRIAAASAPPERFLPDDADDGRRALGPLPGKALLLGVSVLTSATVLLTLIGFILAYQLT